MPRVPAVISYGSASRYPFQRTIVVDPGHRGGGLPIANPMHGVIDDIEGPARAIATGALVFHGYRRTGSIVWALLYGVAGRIAPKIAVPVALAQGFGKKKPCP